MNVKKKKERLNDVLWIEEEEWKSCIVAAEPVDVFDACQPELCIGDCINGILPPVSKSRFTLSYVLREGWSEQIWMYTQLERCLFSSCNKELWSMLRPDTSLFFSSLEWMSILYTEILCSNRPTPPTKKDRSLPIINHTFNVDWGCVVYRALYIRSEIEWKIFSEG